MTKIVFVVVRQVGAIALVYLSLLYHFLLVPNFHYDGLLYPPVNFTSRARQYLDEYNITERIVVELETHFIWSNFTSAKKQLIPINGSGYVELGACSVVRQHDHLIHIKNIYCSKENVLASENSQIIFRGQGSNTYLSHKKHFPACCSYKHVLLLYSKYCGTFGHFMHDTLSGLLIVPHDIINKSAIILLLFSIS